MSQKHVDILKYASSLIRTRTFICHSVESYPSCKEQKQILKWISKSLFPYFTYGEWLRENHEDVWQKEYRWDEYTGRVQWINWMIKNHTIFDDVEV